MMAGKAHDTSRIDDLLASVSGDLLGELQQSAPDTRLRVERILLELVRPDPVQPRRVLPESIHLAFHNSRLTPTQSLRELVQLVQVAARQRGRPFSSVLELLPNPDDEREDEADVKLSPEEELLRDLVNLAVTIRDDGQVNPLTVVDVSQGVTPQFRIETGERRYWATWLLRDFIPQYSGDGMIPCIVIPANQSSIFRQAKENTARAGLTAVAMARQAALLLLTVHGYEIPAYAVGHDFYRQALELDLRSRREYTDVILSAMGGIKRAQFSLVKSLLRLSDEALELAGPARS
ncbi:MAG: ParB N-terminal domain-containing protein [Chloroflexi bacterium]|nr:ParB N-terminal domain-containing protein [Chloroflexota bacterium]